MKKFFVMAATLGLFTQAAFAQSFECAFQLSGGPLFHVSLKSSPPRVAEVYTAALSGHTKRGVPLPFLEMDAPQVFAYGVSGPLRITLTVDTRTSVPSVILFEQNIEDATTSSTNLICQSVRR